MTAKEQTERLEEYLAEARRALQDGEYDSAVNACDEALRLGPDDTRARTLLEQARAALQRQQAEALQLWAARQLDLAKQALAAQAFDDATEILEHIERHRPNLPGRAELLQQARLGRSAAADRPVPTTAAPPAPSAPIQEQAASGVPRSAAASRVLFTRPSLAIAGAALVVLLAIASIRFLRSPTPATPDTQSGQSQQSPSATAAPAAAGSATADAARRPSADQQVAELRDRAAEQFSRGEWQNGIRTAAAAFALRQDDPGLQAILSDALTTARSRAAAERETTTAAGRRAVATDAFRAAVRRLQRIDQLQRSGQTANAIQAAWEAADFFQQARSEAQRASEDVPATSPTAASATAQPSAPPPAPATVAAAATRPDAQPAAPSQPPVAAERPTPPTVPAPPAAKPALSDEAAIHALLQEYTSAYSRLDAAGVKRVYPGINDRALIASMSAMRSLVAQIVNVQVSNLTSTAATVTGTWDVRYTRQVGGSHQETRKVTLRLERTNGAWIIVDRR